MDGDDEEEGLGFLFPENSDNISKEHDYCRTNTASLYKSIPTWDDDVMNVDSNQQSTRDDIQVRHNPISLPEMHTGGNNPSYSYMMADPPGVVVTDANLGPRNRTFAPCTYGQDTQNPRRQFLPSISNVSTREFHSNTCMTTQTVTQRGRQTDMHDFDLDDIGIVEPNVNIYSDSRHNQFLPPISVDNHRYSNIDTHYLNRQFVPPISPISDDDQCELCTSLGAYGNYRQSQFLPSISVDDHIQRNTSHSVDCLYRHNPFLTSASIASQIRAQRFDAWVDRQYQFLSTISADSYYRQNQFSSPISVDNRTQNSNQEVDNQFCRQSQLLSPISDDGIDRAPWIDSQYRPSQFLPPISGDCQSVTSASLDVDSYIRQSQFLAPLSVDDQIPSRRNIDVDSQFCRQSQLLSPISVNNQIPANRNQDVVQATWFNSQYRPTVLEPISADNHLPLNTIQTVDNQFCRQSQFVSPISADNEIAPNTSQDVVGAAWFDNQYRPSHFLTSIAGDNQSRSTNNQIVDSHYRTSQSWESISVDNQSPVGESEPQAANIEHQDQQHTSQASMSAANVDYYSEPNCSQVYKSAEKIVYQSPKSGNNVRVASVDSQCRPCEDSTSQGETSASKFANHSQPISSQVNTRTEKVDNQSRDNQPSTSQGIVRAKSTEDNLTKLPNINSDVDTRFNLFRPQLPGFITDDVLSNSVKEKNLAVQVQRKTNDVTDVDTIDHLIQQSTSQGVVIPTNRQRDSLERILLDWSIEDGKKNTDTNSKGCQSQSLGDSPKPENVTPDRKNQMLRCSTVVPANIPEVEKVEGRQSDKLNNKSSEAKPNEKNEDDKNDTEIIDVEAIDENTSRQSESVECSDNGASMSTVNDEIFDVDALYDDDDVILIGTENNMVKLAPVDKQCGQSQTTPPTAPDASIQAPVDNSRPQIQTITCTAADVRPAPVDNKGSQCQNYTPRRRPAAVARSRRINNQGRPRPHCHQWMRPGVVLPPWLDNLKSIYPRIFPHLRRNYIPIDPCIPPEFLIQYPWVDNNSCRQSLPLNRANKRRKGELRPWYRYNLGRRPPFGDNCFSDLVRRVLENGVNAGTAEMAREILSRLGFNSTVRNKIIRRLMAYVANVADDDYVGLLMRTRSDGRPSIYSIEPSSKEKIGIQSANPFAHIPEIPLLTDFGINFIIDGESNDRPGQWAGRESGGSSEPSDKPGGAAHPPSQTENNHQMKQPEAEGNSNSDSDVEIISDSEPESDDDTEPQSEVETDITALPLERQVVGPEDAAGVNFAKEAKWNHPTKTKTIKAVGKDYGQKKEHKVIKEKQKFKNYLSIAQKFYSEKKEGKKKEGTEVDDETDVIVITSALEKRYYEYFLKLLQLQPTTIGTWISDTRYQHIFMFRVKFPGNNGQEEEEHANANDAEVGRENPDSAVKEEDVQNTEKTEGGRQTENGEGCSRNTELEKEDLITTKTVVAGAIRKENDTDQDEERREPKKVIDTAMCSKYLDNGVEKVNGKADGDSSAKDKDGEEEDTADDEEEHVIDLEMGSTIVVHTEGVEEEFDDEDEEEEDTDEDEREEVIEIGSNDETDIDGEADDDSTEDNEEGGEEDTDDEEGEEVIDIDGEEDDDSTTDNEDSVDDEGELVIDLEMENTNGVPIERNENDNSAEEGGNLEEENIDEDEEEEMINPRYCSNEVSAIKGEEDDDDSTDENDDGEEQDTDDDEGQHVIDLVATDDDEEEHLKDLEMGITNRVNIEREENDDSTGENDNGEEQDTDDDEGEPVIDLGMENANLQHIEEEENSSDEENCVRDTYKGEETKTEAGKDENKEPKQPMNLIVTDNAPKTLVVPPREEPNQGITHSFPSTSLIRTFNTLGNSAPILVRRVSTIGRVPPGHSLPIKRAVAINGITMRTSVQHTFTSHPNISEDPRDGNLDTSSTRNVNQLTSNYARFTPIDDRLPSNAIATPIRVPPPAVTAQPATGSYSIAATFRKPADVASSHITSKQVRTPSGMANLVSLPELAELQLHRVYHNNTAAEAAKPPTTPNNAELPSTSQVTDMALSHVVTTRPAETLNVSGVERDRRHLNMTARPAFFPECDYEIVSLPDATKVTLLRSRRQNTLPTQAAGPVAAPPLAAAQYEQLANNISGVATIRSASGPPASVATPASVVAPQHPEELVLREGNLHRLQQAAPNNVSDSRVVNKKGRRPKKRVPTNSTPTGFGQVVSPDQHGVLKRNRHKKTVHRNRRHSTLPTTQAASLDAIVAPQPSVAQHQPLAANTISRFATVQSASGPSPYVALPANVGASTSNHPEWRNLQRLPQGVENNATYSKGCKCKSRSKKRVSTNSTPSVVGQDPPQPDTVQYQSQASNSSVVDTDRSPLNSANGVTVPETEVSAYCEVATTQPVASTSSHSEVLIVSDIKLNTASTSSRVDKTKTQSKKPSDRNLTPSDDGSSQSADVGDNAHPNDRVEAPQPTALTAQASEILAFLNATRFDRRRRALKRANNVDRSETDDAHYQVNYFELRTTEFVSAKSQDSNVDTRKMQPQATTSGTVRIIRRNTKALLLSYTDDEDSESGEDTNKTDRTKGTPKKN